MGCFVCLFFLDFMIFVENYVFVITWLPWMKPTKTKTTLLKMDDQIGRACSPGQWRAKSGLANKLLEKPRARNLCDWEINCSRRQKAHLFGFVLILQYPEKFSKPSESEYTVIYFTFINRTWHPSIFELL